MRTEDFKDANLRSQRYGCNFSHIGMVLAYKEPLLEMVLAKVKHMSNVLVLSFLLHLLSEVLFYCLPCGLNSFRSNLYFSISDPYILPHTRTLIAPDCGPVPLSYYQLVITSACCSFTDT